MEEMYGFGLSIHYVSVLLLIGVAGFNMALLAAADEIHYYARRMRMVMPVFGMTVAVAIFTGVVMMAAKHLSFTLENIAMIVLSIVLIVLESKRYGMLKRTDPRGEGALETYKNSAFRILASEMVLLLCMTAWMHMI